RLARNALRTQGRLGWNRIVVAAAADVEQGLGVFQLVGPRYGEPVFPNRTINVFLSTPALRSKLEHVSFVALARNGANQLPAINGIALVDIPIKCRFLTTSHADKQQHAND